MCIHLKSYLPEILDEPSIADFPNPNPTMILKPSITRESRGFALVISLSLMVLLVAISVGLLGISAISLRSSTQSEAMQVARANARMALTLALGELQKNAGPDQAITASSSILSGKQCTRRRSGGGPLARQRG
jgi:Tfp pilus assembly protein PilX